MSKATLAVAAALAIAGLSGCGGDGDVSRAKLRSQLIEKSELTATQATCVSDAVFDEFDQDEINDLYTAESEANVPEDDLDRFKKILDACARKG